MGTEALLSQLFGDEDIDPFPLYDELRETGGGVHFFGPLGGWLVCRYSDVAMIGKDNKTFSSEHFWHAAPGQHDPNDPEHRRFVRVSSRQFMFHDPPAHTRMRTVMQPAFTGHASKRWRPIIEQRVAELLDRFSPGHEIEFMTDFAGEVPVAIIADIIGAAPDGRADFRRWSQALAATFDPGIQGAARDTAIRESNELVDYLHDVIEQRRRVPADDLTTALVTARDENGEPLPDDEVLGSLALLLTAGNDTTVNLLGNGLTFLLDEPEVLRSVCDSAARIPAALEEMLRLDPPLHLDIRLTTRPVTLGGVEIDAGQVVWLVLPAANRDPRVFDDPTTFDPQRRPNRHLTFLPGHHHCVGAPLARLEGDIIFTRLLERFPGLGPGSVPAKRRTSNKVARGWLSRPVRL